MPAPVKQRERMGQVPVLGCQQSFPAGQEGPPGPSMQNLCFSYQIIPSSLGEKILVQGN